MKLWLCVGAAVLVVAVVGAAGHECIHDEMVAQHVAAHGALAFDQAPSPLGYTLAGDATPSAAHPHTAVRSFSRGPIRFHLDFSQMAGDSRTCYTASGHVAVGTPPPGPPESNVCATGAATGCYIECTAENVLSTEKRNHIETVLLTAATEYLSSALDVIQVGTPLTVAAEDGMCRVRDDVPIPSIYTGAGVNNVDIALLVTARPTAGSLLAYAGACRVDQYARPTMAHINFGPGSITVGPVLPTELGTAIHELVHGLGFTATGRTGFGKFLNLADNTTREYSHVVGATVDVGAGGANAYSYDAINTTLALAEARTHYGCSTLKGVPLEQQGGSGTATSHWEKRVFWDELMTGTSSANPRVSRITLALLEDSGWYTAKMAAAQDFTYGKGQGCAFIHSKCVAGSWPAEYLCSVNDARACNYDRSARAQCQIVTYPAGPNAPTAPYQYFSDVLQGGGDPIADFCPVNIEFSNGVCAHTTNADTVNDPFFAQVWGRDSICIDSTIGLNAGEENIRCYRAGCTSASAASVQVGLDWTSCAGGESGLAAAGYTGTWDCPETTWITNTCGTLSAFPTITAVEPSSLTLAGGESVTVSGSGFAADMSVVIGPLPCTNVVVAPGGVAVTCTTVSVEIPSFVRDNVATASRAAAVIRADKSAAVLTTAVEIVVPSGAAAMVGPGIAFWVALTIVSALVVW